MEKLNRLIASKEIKSAIKKFPVNKSLGRDGFMGELYLTFKRELIPIHLKLFQKQKRKENFEIHFMRPALPQYQNQIKKRHH